MKKKYLLVLMRDGYPNAVTFKAKDDLEAFRVAMSEINSWTGVDKYFMCELKKIKNNIDLLVFDMWGSTGNRKGKSIPKKEWIDDIVKNCDEANVLVFMKESLRELMGEDFRQDELPWQKYVRLERENK